MVFATGCFYGSLTKFLTLRDTRASDKAMLAHDMKLIYRAVTSDKEIKRRIKVIEAFSTEHNLEKMLYLILREEDEKLQKRRMPNIQFLEGKHN